VSPGATPRGNTIELTEDDELAQDRDQTVEKTVDTAEAGVVLLNGTAVTPSLGFRSAKYGVPLKHAPDRAVVVDSAYCLNSQVSPKGAKEARENVLVRRHQCVGGS
jgi:hypothetical protein